MFSRDALARGRKTLGSDPAAARASTPPHWNHRAKRLPIPPRDKTDAQIKLELIQHPQNAMQLEVLSGLELRDSSVVRAEFAGEFAFA